MNLKSVTTRELYKVIDKIPSQKIDGPETIPTWALENCKLSIGFRLQLNTNTLPDILKEANITHICKNCDRQNPENYPPITVTPILTKIFERFLLEQMLQDLDMNKIINKNPFGFQKQKSCLNTKIALK